MAALPTPAGWYPDPAGTGGRRYWDGDTWGPSEPSPAHPPAGWYPDPSGGEGRRYWTRQKWGPREPTQSVTGLSDSLVDVSNTPPETTAYAPQPDADEAPSSRGSRWNGSSRRTRIVAACAAAALLMGLIAVIVVSDHQKNSVSCSAAAPNPSRNDFVQENSLKDSLSDTWNKPGTIGEEVRDGDLAFVVDVIAVCDDGYARISMTVTNTSDYPSTFDPENQRLLRNLPPASGPIPEDEGECQLCDGTGDRVRINPGDSIETLVEFAIVGDPAIMAVELHDSSLSFGAKVYP